MTGNFFIKNLSPKSVNLDLSKIKGKFNSSTKPKILNSTSGYLRHKYITSETVPQITTDNLTQTTISQVEMASGVFDNSQNLKKLRKGKKTSICYNKAIA